MQLSAQSCVPVNVCQCKRAAQRERKKRKSRSWWKRSSKIFSLHMSMIVISSLSGSHHVAHWLGEDNWQRRTYISLFYSIHFLSPLHLQCLCLCACCVCVFEENKTGGEHKKKSLLLQMFYELHIMTRYHIFCPIFSECAQQISAIPTAKPTKPGALAPKDKPLKLEWQVEHFEATRKQTPLLPGFPLSLIYLFILACLSSLSGQSWVTSEPFNAAEAQMPSCHNICL